MTEGPVPGQPQEQTSPGMPKPGLVPLRPLTVGEILDGSFTAIRWNPKTILTSSATVAAISAILIAVVSYFVERQVLASVPVSGNGTQVNVGQLVVVIALAGLAALVAGLANLILTGLLTVTVGQGVLGRKETVTSAWRAARPRLWRLFAMLLLVVLFFAGMLLVTGVLVGVVIGEAAHLPAAVAVVAVIGVVVAWVFAVIAAIRWSLAIPVVMLEGLGPVKSLGRSWRLVKRSSWRVFGILLLTELIVGIASEMINLPFALGGGGGGAGFLVATSQQVNVVGLILTAIGQIIASTLTAPLLAGVIVLLYADLRMRREGMDITLQAAAAGGPSSARTRL